MTRVLIFFMAFMFYACTDGEIIHPSFYDCTLDLSTHNPNHSRHEDYTQLLNDIVKQGVPGIIMNVNTPSEGNWTGSAGKADLFNDIDLQMCNITRVGSTVKMFTATALMILIEEGKLNLDDRIAMYLHGDVIDKIENADKATIRQLLQHTSGIYNYIQNLKFQTASLNDPVRVWKPNDLLRYAYHKKSYFKPGEDVIYSNTNYIMLGMLIEIIEGKPFYEVFNEKIFIPLNLTNTSFAAEDPVPDGIIRGYIDLYSNLNVIESTYYSGWDYYTADGGLISNPVDMNIFFKALIDGELISQEMLTEMLSWQSPKQKDPEFYPLYYGMGIFKMDTPVGEVYFHSGDAIGYYANMMYIKQHDMFISYAVNGNYGKIDESISTKNAIEKILKTIVE